jgi:hypothetical protein
MEFLVAVRVDNMACGKTPQGRSCAYFKSRKTDFGEKVWGVKLNGKKKFSLRLYC